MSVLIVHGDVPVYKMHERMDRRKRKMYEEYSLSTVMLSLKDKGIEHWVLIFFISIFVN